jgi:hypothetical protein
MSESKLCEGSGELMVSRKWWIAHGLHTAGTVV